MEKESTLDAETRLLGPGETMKLLENTDLNVHYVPIEAGRAWQDIVLPADHVMIEAIVVASIKGMREVNIPGTSATEARRRENNEDDDENDDMDMSSPPPKQRGSSTYRTNYQITKNATAHRYSIVLEFPPGAHFSLEEMNQVYVLYPNRIIQAESKPFVSPHGLQGFRWTVTMDKWTIYSEADYIFMHSNAHLQKTVTHVFPETIGRNNEGRGIKRQRDEQGEGMPVTGKKNK